MGLVQTDQRWSKLATLNNANTAVCWEFTMSGFASVGSFVCHEADAFVTISVDWILIIHSEC